MDKDTWQPNRLERFLIDAPFWLRVLVVLCGLGVLGLILGAVDGLVDVCYTS